MRYEADQGRRMIQDEMGRSKTIEDAAVKRIAGPGHFDLVTPEYYGPPEGAPDAETEIGKVPAPSARRDSKSILFDREMAMAEMVIRAE